MIILFRMILYSIVGYFFIIINNITILLSNTTTEKKIQSPLSDLNRGLTPYDGITLPLS